MSIIQQIRDRAAWLVFGVIALSLLGFLLMDAFVGRSGSGMFSSQSTSLGKINGTTVEYADFSKKRTALENQYRQSGYPVNEMMQQNIQDQIWNQYIEENVLKAESKELGLDVSAKELNDILFGANPPQALRQQFSNPQTGVYDANAARSAIDALRKQKDNENAKSFEELFLPGLVDNRLKEKYTSLLANSAYVPKWMVEKQNADNNQIASISFVNASYAAISDSAIKVTDADINSYVSNHKEEYKQPENRSISYVTFSAAPTSKDSMDVFNELVKAKEEFLTTTDVPAFLIRNGSETKYDGGYVLKSKLQVPNALIIQEMADGQVFGPYLDATNYTLAKMVSKRSMPDSVKVRHILIGVQPGAPDSVAKTRIDSIQAAIRAGADFAALARQVSDDQGSKENGGEYDFSSQQFSTLAKEFAETAFYGSAGDKKVVKTDFGYHYIEVISQKNFEQAFNIAYLSKPILPSQETQNTASGMANQFAGESRDSKAFEANLAKNKYARLVATDIKPIDNMIPALGSSRQLVKWIYEADKGDVSDPYDLGDKYVVAMVTEINKEGVMSAAKARPMVEFIVRNQKKAEEIIKKIGNATTLDAVSKAVNSPILRADSVSFATPVIANVGQEPKVIGYTFSKDLANKISPPIPGNGGVFVIKRESLSAKAGLENLEQQRTSMMQQMKSMSGFRSLEALKKSADVKDERAKLL
jgi:peptidyl-prolyl cis-trans isomerase D